MTDKSSLAPPPAFNRSTTTLHEADSHDELDDPELRLRIVRTATETLNVADQEDSRRRVGKRRLGTFKNRKSLFGTISRKRRASTAEKDKKETLSPPRKATAATSSLSDSLSPRPTALGGEEQLAKAAIFTSPQDAEAGTATAKGSRSSRKAAELRRRRNVWVNVDLPDNELGKNGQPVAVWARNKVRTSKYTPLTFIPKVRLSVASACTSAHSAIQNLTEQFRRVANMYFLALVVLQGDSNIASPFRD